MKYLGVVLLIQLSFFLGDSYGLGLRENNTYGSQTKNHGDIRPFLDQLDSLGLNTYFIRHKLLPVIKIKFKKQKLAGFYWKPGKTFYLDKSLKVKNSQKIRSDLSSLEMSYIIHELIHCANDLLASENAPRGSVEREHGDLIESIWADIYLDRRNHTWFGLPRFSRSKADEVMAHYFDSAFLNYLWDVKALLIFNRGSLGIKDPRKLEELGGQISLKDEAICPNGHMCRTRQLHKVHHSAESYSYFFFLRDIHWLARAHVEKRMYRNILGLNMPETLGKLIERLNKLQTPWMKKIRENIISCRNHNIRLLSAGESTVHCYDIDLNIKFL